MRKDSGTVGGGLACHNGNGFRPAGSRVALNLDPWGERRGAEESPVSIGQRAG